MTSFALLLEPDPVLQLIDKIIEKGIELFTILNSPVFQNIFNVRFF